MIMDQFIVSLCVSFLIYFLRLSKDRLLENLHLCNKQDFEILKQLTEEKA